MALSAGVNYRIRPNGLVSVRVKTGVTIFNGALVGLHTNTADQGLAVNWADALTTTEIKFLGIARIHDQLLDKVVGDGTVEVEVDTSGVVIQGVVVTGLNNNNLLGALVYASDENTFTVSATTGKTPVGTVVRVVSTANTIGDVELFSSQAARSGSDAQYGT
jgi:hypothetical protein